MAFLEDTFGPIAETESNGQLPIRIASRRRREMKEKQAFQDKVAALDKADETMEADMVAKMVNVGSAKREASMDVHTQVSDDRVVLADSDHVEDGPLPQSCDQEGQPLSPQQELPQHHHHQQHESQGSRAAMLAKRKAYLRRMQERQQQHA